MSERRTDKHKGGQAHHRRSGLGRIRRAHRSDGRRTGNLADRIDDESFLVDPQDGDHRDGHTGASLLARFNRLARSSEQEDGEDGVVCGFDGAHILVRDRDGTEHRCEMRRTLRKMLPGVKAPLSIGDRIRFQPQDTGLAVIVALLPRDNQLARSDSHNRSLEHIFAANIDRLVIVASLDLPPLRAGLIDRYLLIAHYNGIEALIVINKSDLGDPTPWRKLYQDLGYPVCCTVADRQQLDDLPHHLRDSACVFAGQSGVGKSSLIHALAPQLDIRIGSVSEAGHKGRHTTIAARSYALPLGLTLIDTPGIRSCGIPPMSPLDVALHYRDIARHHQHCRFQNCTHIHEPDCAVRAAVAAGHIAQSRYDSYCSILAEDLTNG